MEPPPGLYVRIEEGAGQEVPVDWLRQGGFSVRSGPQGILVGPFGNLAPDSSTSVVDAVNGALRLGDGEPLVATGLWVRYEDGSEGPLIQVRTGLRFHVTRGIHVSDPDGSVKGADTPDTRAVSALRALRASETFSEALLLFHRLGDTWLGLRMTLERLAVLGGHEHPKDLVGRDVWRRFMGTAGSYRLHGPRAVHANGRAPPEDPMAFETAVELVKTHLRAAARRHGGDALDAFRKA